MVGGTWPFEPCFMNHESNLIRPKDTFLDLTFNVDSYPIRPDIIQSMVSTDLEIFFAFPDYLGALIGKKDLVIDSHVVIRAK